MRSADGDESVFTDTYAVLSIAGVHEPRDGRSTYPGDTCDPSRGHRCPRKFEHESYCFVRRHSGRWRADASGASSLTSILRSRLMARAAAFVPRTAVCGRTSAEVPGGCAVLNRGTLSVASSRVICGEIPATRLGASHTTEAPVRAAPRVDTAVAVSPDRTVSRLSRGFMLWEAGEAAGCTPARDRLVCRQQSEAAISADGDGRFRTGEGLGVLMERASALRAAPKVVAMPASVGEDGRLCHRTLPLGGTANRAGRRRPTRTTGAMFDVIP